MKWLIAASKGNDWPQAAIIPIDEEEKCALLHERYADGTGLIPRLYHFIRNRGGAYSLRCPRSLTAEERERVYEGTEKDAKAQAKSLKTSKRSSSSEDSWRQ